MSSSGGGCMRRLGAVTLVLSGFALAGWGDRATAQAAVVWAVGDAGDGSDQARAIGSLIAADSPDALLYLGDVYPDGRAEDFAERYHPAFGALKPVTWPTPGNHDWTNRRT